MQLVTGTPLALSKTVCRQLKMQGFLRTISSTLRLACCSRLAPTLLLAPSGFYATFCLLHHSSLKFEQEISKIVTRKAVDGIDTLEMDTTGFQ